jgi:uncharacterized GH25 family protein
MTPRWNRPRRMVGVLIGLLFATAGTLLAHDFFLKPDAFFLPSDATAVIPILNGTFATSENTVDRVRFLDVSMVTPRGRTRLDTTAIAFRHDTTLLTIHTGPSGTYQVGVATLPRELDLPGADFNAYLKEEAITGILEDRTRRGELEKPARERYAKHAKTLIQVGAQRSTPVGPPLGHRAELVPVDNPYALAPGGSLRVRCLLEGKPISGQEVIAGGTDAKGLAIKEQVLRSNGDGVVSVRLDRPGKWFLKFVHMVRSQRTGVDYESDWATLTFELRAAN